jgi:hypothetical protein
MVLDKFLFDNISDFEKLISLKVEKSVSLEFLEKSKVSETQSFGQKISILVSSMANTVGGIVFLGLKTSKKRVVSLENLENVITLDWLNYIIQQNISPDIENVDVKEFVAENVKIIIIKIPKSKQAPHIAFDSRFYARNNSNTILLQEHEIRNLYTKNSNPELEFVGITNTNGTPTNKLGKIDFITFYPKFLIRNIGEKIERVFKIELSMPTSLHDSNYFALQNYFTRFDEDMIVFTINSRNPIFQNEIYTIAEAKLTVNIDNFYDFETGFINIKLFYSKGVRSSKINLVNSLVYNGQKLSIEQFVNNDKQIFIAN